jgi:hypothetical protein
MNLSRGGLRRVKCGSLWECWIVAVHVVCTYTWQNAASICRIAGLGWYTFSGKGHWQERAAAGQLPMAAHARSWRACTIFLVSASLVIDPCLNPAPWLYMGYSLLGCWQHAVGIRHAAAAT